MTSQVARSPACRWGAEIFEPGFRKVISIDNIAIEVNQMSIIVRSPLSRTDPVRVMADKASSISTPQMFVVLKAVVTQQVALAMAFKTHGIILRFYPAVVYVIISSFQYKMVC